MSTNVSFEYANAVKKYDKATNPIEKLVALQEMKSTVPSHKGCENLRRDISRKISALKHEMDKQKQQAKKTSGSGYSLNVKKEGMGQIVLVGLPNSGKSTILKNLTNADVEIADYPFTTTKPVQGMVDFFGARIQLVEVPALIKGSAKGKANGTQLISVIRNSDAVVVLAETKKDFQKINKELIESNILLNQEKPKIKIRPSEFPGFSITGKKYLKIPQKQLVDFLKGLGMYNVDVILGEPTTLDKVGQALNEKLGYKRALVLTRKKENKKALEKESKGRVIVLDHNTDEIKTEFFRLLRKILVYTKRPGEDAKMDEPMVLNEGEKVGEAARQLHKDFETKLKFVKVWGSSKFPGQRVSKNYVLKDKDIIEVAL